MYACVRGPAPDLLAQHAQAVGEDYAARRRANPAYRFQWPQREGIKLYVVAHAGLDAMTAGRCAYCDGFPIDATGEEQIDHFRPKARPEFYALVCAWENLFLICTACNKAKLDQWDDALLRPDVDFHFSRYFMFDAASGILEVNPRASRSDQHRAGRTIEILDLNRKGACIARRNAWRALVRDPSGLADSAYRYLADLGAA